MDQQAIQFDVVVAFRDLLRPLPARDVAELEADILERGIRDRLVVWRERNILLDGHHRFEIATRHGLDYETIDYSFADDVSARLWVIGNQLRRRNLTDWEVSYYRGKQYEEEKKSHGVRGAGKKSVQNEHSFKTRARLATEHGVSAATIQRDSKLAKAIDTIGEVCGAEAKTALLEGGSGVTLGSLRDRKITIADVQEWAKASVDGDYKAAVLNALRGASGTPAALQSSGSNEWYTPSKFIEAARRTMGGIDLDPASCEQANETVRAARYYSAADNGLTMPWRGRVWLNPPYGRSDGASNQGIWSSTLARTYLDGRIDAACLLINAVTDRVWFWPLWEFPICFVHKRIRFHSPSADKAAPTHGSAIVYFGRDCAAFVEHFKPLGQVVLPHKAGASVLA